MLKTTIHTMSGHISNLKIFQEQHDPRMYLRFQASGDILLDLQELATMAQRKSPTPEGASPRVNSWHAINEHLEVCIPQSGSSQVQFREKDATQSVAYLRTLPEYLATALIIDQSTKRDLEVVIDSSPLVQERLTSPKQGTETSRDSSVKTSPRFS